MAISLDELKQLAAQRLAHFPLFRRKLHRVALGMDTPYWVDIAEPDWDRHISESSLPGSGDWDTLQQTLGRLHGARMDPDHPLWEMHLIQTGGSPQLFKLPPPYQSELGRTF